MVNWEDRITVHPQRMVGQPCIRGSRITVALVLRKLAGGMSVDEFLEQYPHVTREDVEAALIYASHNLQAKTPVGG